MRCKLSQGKETNILKEKPKVTYSVALVLAFLSDENENRQLEDLPLADFGCLLEIILLSVRTTSLTKNCLFNHNSTHFSVLRVSANALYDCYSGIVDSFIFSHLMKSAFLVSKGLLRSYDKQNNTWLLVDMEFFHLCSTRLVTRELLS